MDRMVVSNPLETSGIVSPPSRATTDREPIIAPVAAPIKAKEIIKSKSFNEVSFDKSSDNFLYIK